MLKASAIVAPAAKDAPLFVEVCPYKEGTANARSWHRRREWHRRKQPNYTERPVRSDLTVSARDCCETNRPLLTGFPSPGRLGRDATGNVAALPMNDNWHGTAKRRLVLGVQLREFFFTDVFNVFGHSTSFGSVVGSNLRCAGFRSHEARIATPRIL